MIDRVFVHSKEAAEMAATAGRWALRERLLRAESDGVHSTFFIVACHPSKGLVRMNMLHATRGGANSWKNIVRNEWRGCHVKVIQFTGRFVDGQPDAVALSEFDKKHNLTSEGM